MQPKPDNKGQFLHHTSCDACGSSDANGVYQSDDGTTNSYCFSCQTYQSGSPGDSRKETTIMTQYTKILSHLVDVGSISGLEANDLYRVRSLPRRIADLRENGFQIKSEWKKDRLGQRYVRYSLTDAMPPPLASEMPS